MRHANECCLDILTKDDELETTVMFRFMSRNRIKSEYKATDEEKLIEVVDELTDSLVLDLVRDMDESEDVPTVLYPKFSAAVAAKASQFTGDKDYRQVCLVPSFALGLCMVGRVGRHYKHCDWFMIGRLVDMVGEYGGVSSY